MIEYQITPVRLTGPRSLVPGENYPYLFEDEDANCKGLYFWLYVRGDRHYLHYVTGTNHIRNRNRNTIISLLRGQLPIPDPDDPSRQVYRPMGRTELWEAWERQAVGLEMYPADISRLVLDYLAAIQVYYACLDRSDDELDRIKTAIVSRLGKEAARAGEEGKYLMNRHKSAGLTPRQDALNVEISLPDGARIEGIPAVLEA